MVSDEYNIKTRINPKIISFGQGGSGILFSEKDGGKNEKGQETIKFLFSPFRDYNLIYDPNKEDFKTVLGEDCLIVRIPKILILRENMSSQTERVKVLCGPNLEPTAYTSLHDEILFKNNSLSATILRRDEEIAKLKLELEKALSPSTFAESIASKVKQEVKETILEMNLKK